MAEKYGYMQAARVARQRDPPQPEKMERLTFDGSFKRSGGSGDMHHVDGVGRRVRVKNKREVRCYCDGICHVDACLEGCAEGDVR
ncbi:hypothetical protein Zmor_022360 [Zophobas morio]|mgnify:FL=1|uniref:Uncharacterized protein n=1 Tax=Zophobas morio TaxID=2755281 RepID=A0AA38M5X2_9CUCU|nr:hypothetical protein Zmor_022360 [Zophobas morio]